METKVEKIWITTTAWKPMATINTIWSYCEQFNELPDKFIFFYNETKDINKNVNEVKKWIDILSKQYKRNRTPESEFIKVKEDSIESYGIEIIKKIKEFENKNNIELYFDITPGRKFISILLCNIAYEIKDRVKGVYYNHLYNNKFIDNPYPIPLMLNSDYRLINVFEFTDYLTFKEKINFCKDKSLVEMTEQFIKSKKNGADIKEIEQFLKRNKKSPDGLMMKNLLTALKQSPDIIQNPNFPDKFILNTKIDSQQIKNKSLINITLKLDEINLYLNQLSTCDYEHISIECATFGIKIFDIILSGTQSIKLSSTEIKLNNFKVPENLKYELSYKPEYWFDLLKMAGIIKPTNFDKVIGIITELYNYQPLKGDPNPFISMDSNLLINRLYSLISDAICGRLREHRIGFVISNKVEEELSGFDNKLKKDQINSLEFFINSNFQSKSSNGKEWAIDAVRNMFNQNDAKDRFFRIGYTDLTRIKQKEYIEFLSYNNQLESNDQKIISSFRDYLDKKNKKVLVLSEDKDFINRLQGIPGIIPFLIEYPPNYLKSKEFNITWKELGQLLYCCALYFGSIIINGEITDNNPKSLNVIQGVWSGKDIEDWNNESLKIWGIEEFLQNIKINLDLIRKI